METNKKDDRVFMKIGEMPHGTIFRIPNINIFIAFGDDLRDENKNRPFRSIECDGDRLGRLGQSNLEIFDNIRFKTNNGWISLAEMKPGQTFFNNRGEECLRVSVEKENDPVAYRCSDAKIIFRRDDTILKLECETFPPEKFNFNFSVTPKEAEIPEVVEDVTLTQEELTEVETTEVIDQIPAAEEKPIKKRGKKTKKLITADEIQEQIEADYEKTTKGITHEEAMEQIADYHDSLPIGNPPNKTSTENSDYVKNFEFRDSE